MGRPTVLIADDQAPTRAGIRLALDADGFDVVAEAADAPEAIVEALAAEPEICLLADHLPGGAIAAVAALAAQLPATRIALLTGSPAAADLLTALRAGADGYLLASVDPRRLPAALRGLLNGEAVVPRALTIHLVDELRAYDRGRAAESEDGFLSLTDREFEVLSLVRDGLSTSAMADRLNISPVTVRRHISMSLRKLGCADRQSAATRLGEWSIGGYANHR
jgi:DNA-binding NarL/FixJ family response regulator